jgi:hypothetical protein
MKLYSALASPDVTRGAEVPAQGGDNLGRWWSTASQDALFGAFLKLLAGR